MIYPIWTPVIGPGMFGGGAVVEAGAKMIPEGGYYAIPRDPESGSIGKGPFDNIRWTVPEGGGGPRYKRM